VPDPSPAPAANKAATRIPVAGAKYVLPRRKRPATLAYPEQLKSQGIEADVTVMVSIDATGKVTAVKIARGSSYPEFDAAARRAAMTEEFEPAMKDGAAIPYTLTFTYRFRLED
jgi:TonB family protein